MKPYVAEQLPPVLTAANGEKIVSAAQWEQLRRPEILRIFEREVFGQAPACPDDLTVTLAAHNPRALDGSAVLDEYEISFSGPFGKFAFPFALFLPQGEGPFPATLLVCNRDKAENMDLTRVRRTGFWPVESIVRRGYAACAFYVGDVDTDEDDGSVHGVQPVFTPERGPHDWATIAAWAWGAMRVMDALELDARIDKAHVAVVGQSRGGKTSLWCAAQNPRFWAIYSSNSGCVGTALSHFKDGETLRQINEVFPYWFCGAFKKYNDREAELPFDQHQLMACVAPRLLYVSASTLDDWADPEAEFLGTKLAGCAWKLYGKETLPFDAVAEPDRPLTSECMGFHNRSGEHDLTEIDWMHFLDFLDRRK